MSSRDAILKRVRQALSVPSPQPHWLHEKTSHGCPFPIPEGDADGLWHRFQKELGELLGESHSFNSLEGLKRWFAEQRFGSMMAVDTPEIRRAVGDLGCVRWIDKSNQSRDGWDTVEVGVTPVLALVAESGTAIVAADIAGRAISVLPPIHIAIAEKNQLVPTLESAMELIRARYGEHMPSSISLISGPSRTADIEKILVMGAHGPRRLIVARAEFELTT